MTFLCSILEVINHHKYQVYLTGEVKYTRESSSNRLVNKSLIYHFNLFFPATRAWRGSPDGGERKRFRDSEFLLPKFKRKLSPINPASEYSHGDEERDVGESSPPRWAKKRVPLNVFPRGLCCFKSFLINTFHVRQPRVRAHASPSSALSLLSPALSLRRRFSLLIPKFGNPGALMRARQFFPMLIAFFIFSLRFPRPRSREAVYCTILLFSSPGRVALNSLPVRSGEPFPGNGFFRNKELKCSSLFWDYIEKKKKIKKKLRPWKP